MKIKKTFFENVKKYWIIIFIILIGIVYSYNIYTGGFLAWDELVYLSNAKSHITTNYFTEDFRFPLLEYTIAGVWSITRESVQVAQYIAVFFSLLCILGIYFLSKEFFEDEKYVAASTILFAISTQMIFWSYRIYTDIPAITLGIYAFYFYLRSLKNNETKNLILSGISIALAFLFRFPIVIIGVIIGANMLFRKKYRQTIYFGASAFITIIPWLIYNTIKYKNPLWDLLAQGSVVAEYTSWQPISKLLILIFNEFGLGLIFIALLIFILIKYQKKIDEKNMLLYLIIGIQLLMHLFLVQLKLSRYILVMSPFIFIMIIDGVKELSRNKKYVALILILILIINSIYLLGEPLKEQKEQIECDQNGARWQTIEYIKQTTHPGQVISSNTWPEYGYYANLNANAVWTTNITNILERTPTTKVIFLKWGGLEVYQEEIEADPTTSLEKVFKDNCGQEIYIYNVTNPPKN